MYNPDIQVAEWRKYNEKISQTWGDSQEFDYAYELVYENSSERLYKLRDEVVYRAAINQGIDTAAVPSLNPEIARWDARTIYDKIQKVDIALNADAPSISVGIRGALAQEIQTKIN